MSRALLLLALTTATLIASAALLGAIVPEPRIPFLTVKTEAFAPEKDTYKLLFFGSSRVHHHISPKLFDAEVERRLGIEVRSFNFGIPALRSHDLLVVLDRVLALEPAKLKWVVLDPASFVATIASVNTGTRREIFWHDAPHTRLAIRSVHCCHPSEDTRRRLGIDLLHLRAFAYRQLSVGLLAEHFEPSTPDRMTEDAKALGPDFDGYEPFEADAEAPPGSRRREFLDRLPRYERAVAELRKPPKIDVDLDPLVVEILEGLISRVEAHGAEPILVVPPGNTRRDDLHTAHARGLIDTLLAYDNAHRYPDLYAVENRRDAGHLDENGARRFTHLLARDVARHLRRSR